MQNNNDIDLWKGLFKANYRLNKKEFDDIKKQSKLLEDRLTTVESIVIAHSKKSVVNSQQLHLLIGGIFICFFLLGFSIEGNVGNSKIAYSSSGLIQVILQVFSVGGLAVALVQHPSIKKIFAK